MAVDLFQTWIVLLRMLARLPDLNSLWLEFSEASSVGLTHLPAALELVRLQLPQLRNLRLSLWASWPLFGVSVEQACWTTIAEMTQLTSLAVSVLDKSCCGLTTQHLTCLSSLSSSLQFLRLANKSNDNWLSKRAEDYTFVGCLTALTGLVMPMVSTRRNLTAIIHCTALRELRLEGPARNGHTHFSMAECAALQQLVHLTCLCLPRARSAQTAEEAGALTSALRSLQMLQVLQAYALDLRILPGLASLTSLTKLIGSWREEQQQLGPQQADVTCSSVKFAANDDAEVVAVGSMTQLTQLTLCVPEGSKVTAMGLAALLRLSQLQEMTYDFRTGLVIGREQVSTLLSALERVPKVSFRVDEIQQIVIEDEMLYCRASGLALPGSVLFSKL
eukprot:gene3431-3703_t